MNFVAHIEIYFVVKLNKTVEMHPISFRSCFWSCANMAS